MSDVLRRWRINTRVLLLAVVLVLTAVAGFQAQQRANRLSAAATQLTSRVMEAKFHSADVAG